MLHMLCAYVCRLTFALFQRGQWSAEYQPGQEWLRALLQCLGDSKITEDRRPLVMGLELCIARVLFTYWGDVVGTRLQLGQLLCGPPSVVRVGSSLAANQAARQCH
jgi:hypothetical protein